MRLKFFRELYHNLLKEGFKKINKPCEKEIINEDTKYTYLGKIDNNMFYVIFIFNNTNISIKELENINNNWIKFLKKLQEKNDFEYVLTINLIITEEEDKIKYFINSLKHFQIDKLNNICWAIDIKKGKILLNKKNSLKIPNLVDIIHNTYKNIEYNSTKCEEKDIKPIDPNSTKCEEKDIKLTDTNSTKYEEKDIKPTDTNSTKYEEKDIKPTDTNSTKYEEKDIKPIDPNSTKCEEKDIKPIDPNSTKYEEKDIKLIDTNSTKYEEKDIKLIDTNSTKYEEKDKENILEIELNKDKNYFLTYSIILINFVVFLFIKSQGGLKDIYSLIKYGALIPEYIIYNKEYFRLITYTFLHGTTMHFLYNSLTLYIFGTKLEKYYGKKIFILIYLISGVVSGIFSIIFTKGIAVGASGAIFGVLGALAVITNIFKINLDGLCYFDILIYISLSIGAGLNRKDIDSFGHIGGLLAGIIISYIICRKIKSKKEENKN